mmetsp:Transcript_20818/g.63350  ORF Transcript_20818/g.63350 Transcript_20818/m.63350 type:complete len:246 (+) Transcript_20818:1475-2212(+)
MRTWSRACETRCSMLDPAVSAPPSTAAERTASRCSSVSCLSFAKPMLPKWRPVAALVLSKKMTSSPRSAARIAAVKQSWDLPQPLGPTISSNVPDRAPPPSPASSARQPVPNTRTVRSRRAKSQPLQLGPWPSLATAPFAASTAALSSGVLAAQRAPVLRLSSVSVVRMALGFAGPASSWSTARCSAATGKDSKPGMVPPDTLRAPGSLPHAYPPRSTSAWSGGGGLTGRASGAGGSRVQPHAPR